MGTRCAVRKEGHQSQHTEYPSGRQTLRCSPRAPWPETLACAAAAGLRTIRWWPRACTPSASMQERPSSLPTAIASAPCESPVLHAGRAALESAPTHLKYSMLCIRTAVHSAGWKPAMHCSVDYSARECSACTEGKWPTCHKRRGGGW